MPKFRCSPRSVARPRELDQRRAQVRGDGTERQMGGDRHGAKGGAGQHHDHVGRRYPATLGYELGLPRVLEADRVELLFRHWAGNHRRCRPGSRQSDRDFQQIERGVGARHARVAGDVGPGRVNLDEGQPKVERGVGLPRVFNQLDRSVPNGRDRARIADGGKNRERECVSVIPALGDHFRSDAGGVAERHGKRGSQFARHQSPRLADMAGQRYSITASRRRSRR